MNICILTAQVLDISDSLHLDIPTNKYIQTHRQT